MNSPVSESPALPLPPAINGHLDVAHVLLTAEEIAVRIRELGAKITQEYAERGARELTLIGIANGAMVFAADLLRTIRLYTRFDTLRVSTYRDGASPVARPRLESRQRLELEGRHLLLLDDILDTGNTLTYVKAELQAQHPASLQTCVLLDKKERRQVPFEAEYVGFSIPDVFVVGYGLDFAERYRNLPFVGVLKAELQNPAAWV